MTDIVDAPTRSRMMSGIRGKNTKPELLVRNNLFGRGFRYRLHYAGLPGKPDLVFMKYHAVIFVHGCFWHGHKCPLFKWPKSNESFWCEKIMANMARDTANLDQLHNDGWRTMIIWECALRRRKEDQLDILFDQIAEWIRGSGKHGEITG